MVKGEIAIGKNPAFQFYPGDWTRDLDDYPLEIEGAWIRICCRLHWSNPYGSATKSLTEWAYVLRTHPNKAGVILKTLLKKHIATGEYLDNQNITISSKRMMEDDRIRKIRQEVGKLGGNPQLKKIKKDLVNQTNNQKSTPSSSSSSSSSNINKTLSQNFDKFWQAYPLRDGKKVTKKESFQYFKDNFKDEETFQLLMKATLNYSNSPKPKDNYAKDPIRFLKKDFWKDWIEEPVKPIDQYSHFEIVGAKNGK